MAIDFIKLMIVALKLISLQRRKRDVGD